jgi:hypothetical protein
VTLAGDRRLQSRSRECRGAPSHGRPDHRCGSLYPEHLVAGQALAANEELMLGFRKALSVCLEAKKYMVLRQPVLVHAVSCSSGP